MFNVPHYSIKRIKDAQSITAVFFRSPNIFCYNPSTLKKAPAKRHKRLFSAIFLIQNTEYIPR
jgi:hypothetical protein